MGPFKSRAGDSLEVYCLFKNLELSKLCACAVLVEKCVILKKFSFCACGPLEYGE